MADKIVDIVGTDSTTHEEVWVGLENNSDDPNGGTVAKFVAQPDVDTSFSIPSEILQEPHRKVSGQSVETIVDFENCLI